MNQEDKLRVLTGVNQQNNNGSALLCQCAVTGSGLLLGNTSDKYSELNQLPKVEFWVTSK